MLAMVALGIGIGGCRINPVTGRPAVTLTSAEREQAIGREAAKQVEVAIGLTDDAALSAYVDAIGQRLVHQLPQGEYQYKFLVADMVEPNAFALPGGFVYVSRGLLAVANSEDELANVIGHEIAHVAARHATQRTTWAAPLAIATGITAMATSIVSPALGQLVAGVGELTGGVVLAKYSRDQEHEADRYGAQLAARAGWDPGGMSRFLRTLERTEALQPPEQKRRPSFFDSHPSTPDRVKQSAERAAELTRADAAPIAAGQTAFLNRLDGLLVGENPANGVFHEGRFLHADLDFSLRFPPNWPTFNARHAVGAGSPQKSAVVILEPENPAHGTPVAAARAAAREVGLDPEKDVREFTIDARAAAGLRAAVRTANGPVAVDATWIGHRQRLYRLTGVTDLAQANRYRLLFAEVAESFRPMTAAERASVRATRLRVVRARAGDTLSRLSARAGSAWTPEEAAVANALGDEALAADQLVKVAIAEPYVAAPAPGASGN